MTDRDRSPYEALQAWRETSRRAEAAARALATAELEAADAARLAQLADEAVVDARGALRSAKQLARKLRSRSNKSGASVADRRQKLSDAQAADVAAHDEHRSAAQRAFDQQHPGERATGT
jgi:hypothetical protein